MSATTLIITASAGAGKTQRISDEIPRRVREEAQPGAAPDRLVAVTFTRKAAGELQARIRETLYRQGLVEEASRLELSAIGTVDSYALRLVQRFAYSEGLSPDIQVIDAADSLHLFRLAVEQAATAEETRSLDALAARFANSPGDSAAGWIVDALAIACKARENDMEAAQLSEMAERSCMTALAMLPAPAEGDLDGQLIALIEECDQALKDNGDRTKATVEVRETIAVEQWNLSRDCWTWASWCRLSKLKPGARSRVCVAALKAHAAKVCAHPQLHADICAWIRLVFAISARAMDAFQKEKKERGVLDIGDLQTIALRLLRKAEVRAELTGEIDLFVVDEFQDTNPLQLAIFQELRQIAAATIWVGDEKQSIYGFRGADARLMQQTFAAMVDAERQSLTTSYRSLPELVRWSSALFARILSDQGQDPERIDLQAHRETPPEILAQGPVLERWALSWNEDRANKEKDAGAIATGVFDLLQSGRLIVDRQTQKPRAVVAGDIAVLTRSNDEARCVAAALRTRGIRVSQALNELTSTLEVRTVLACLRLIADGHDALSAAELALASGIFPDLDRLIQHRLQFLDSAPSADAKRDPYLADCDALKKLAALRGGEAQRLAPSDLIDHILIELELPRALSEFGDGEARRANLERLRRYVRDYEDRCQRLGQGASLAGLLRWLESLPEGGEQAAALDGNAVSVLSYHRAKGLEWPVVIAFRPAERDKPAPWTLRVEASAGFDPERALAGRWIRYWPNPFAGQKTPEGFATRDSTLVAAKEQAEAGEEARLMYVGLTRARDFQILAHREVRKNSSEDSCAWLPALSPPGSAQPIEWIIGGERFKICERRLYANEAELQSEKIALYPLRPGAAAHPPRFTSPTEAAATKMAIGETVLYGEMLTFPAGLDRELLGSALHAFLAADDPSLSEAWRAGRLLETMASFLIEETIDPAPFLRQAARFFAWLEQRYMASAMHREWPFELVQDKAQILRGRIDLLLESGGVHVLIDHKSYTPRSGKPVESQLHRRALDFSGQISAYRDAIARASGKETAACWIHFFGAGAMVELHCV